MVVYIKGAGDLATGIAHRLFASKFQVVMSEIEHPTSIRRTVCFSEAVRCGKTQVEGVIAQRAMSLDDVKNCFKNNIIPVLIDPKSALISKIKPFALVDAIIAKKNMGTAITDAPLVIAVGPGFTAGVDCHYIIESMRGHYLGRVIESGSAIPNTATPGSIDGFTFERIIRSPSEGVFKGSKKIGDFVKKGEVVGYVNSMPLVANIDGILRGLIADDTKLYSGMKSGDVDPRGKREYCFTISDKARAIAGGVLEALLRGN